MTDPVVVVPCFNEARRLSPQGFLPLLERARILFVDDGSSDGTLGLLDQIAEALPGRASVLALPENGGKAEAVRQGLLAAIASGATVVAYLDADLAAPADEMVRLLFSRIGPSRSRSERGSGSSALASSAIPRATTWAASSPRWPR